MRTLVTILILMLPFGVWGQVFEVYPVHQSGPPSERIDIVILGDGYTVDEQDQMEADADRIAARFFDEEVFRRYKNFFNIILIKAISEESGASHPGTAFDEPPPSSHPVKIVNNYFGSSFDRGGTHRAILPTNYSAIYSTLSANYPQYDNILVMVNTPYYGGAASGSVAAFTLHPSAPFTALHELGHSLGRVADEYDYGINSPREAPNATSETRREFIRWNHWIEDSTPIPTPEVFTNSQLVGLFEGAVYRPTGWYRPKLNCKMRSSGYEFCEVCREELVINFYRYATPILSYFPDGDELVIDGRGELPFTAELVEVENPAFSWSWRINDVPIAHFGDELRLEVDTSSGEGFKVTLVIEDTTAFVRKNVISTTRDWIVKGTLLNSPIRPSIDSFLPENATSGDTIVISGNSFALTPAYNHVTVNGRQLEVISASSNELKVKVPPVYLNGRLHVEVLNASDSSDGFFTTYPEVTKLESQVGLPGDTLIFLGNNFSDIPDWNLVGQDNCSFEVLESRFDRITALVPECTVSGFVKVTTKNSVFSDSVFFRLETDTLPGPDIASQWQFGTSLPDSLFRLIPMSNGSYMAGGSVQRPGSGYDYWIAFLDRQMRVQWEKTFGGTGDDILTDIQETFDGGLVITGYSDSDKSSQKTEDSKGLSDFWVVRLSNYGTRIWDKTIGGAKAERENYLACSSDGTITLGGSSNSDISGNRTALSHGQYDFWVVNLTDNGEIISDWAYGGNRDERVSAMCKGPSGDMIISGTSSSDATGTKSQGRSGFNDLWVISITAEGQVNWERTVGGSKRELGGYLRGLEDGNFLLAGSSDSPAGSGKLSERIGGFDYWLVELDNDGEVLNEKVFGTSEDDILQHLDIWGSNEDVRIFVGGYTSGGKEFDKGEDNFGKNDYWILSVGRQFEKIWDRSVGGYEDDFLSDLIPVSRRHIFIAGTSRSGTGVYKTFANFGQSDLWLVELSDDTFEDDEFENPYVEIEQELVFGGSNTDYLISILPHPDGSVYYAGYSKSRISGNKEIQPIGLFDYWLIKTDKNGNKLWEKVYGGTHNDELSDAILTSDGNIILAGSSRSSVSGNVSSQPRGDFDYWIIKVNNEGEVIWDQRYGGNRIDKLEKIIEIREGGFIVGGSSNSDISGEKSEAIFRWGDNAYPSDYWVIRIDQEGNFIWDRTLGGNSEDNLKVLAQDVSGDIYAGGISRSGNSGLVVDSQSCLSNQSWICKLDLNGNFIWGKSINYSYSKFDNCYGLADNIVEIIPDPAGGLECFSQIGILINDDDYIEKPVLMKFALSSDGQISDEKYSDRAIFLEDIIKAPDDSYYASLRSGEVYRYYLTVGSPEIYGRSDYGLMRLDRDFNILWSTSFGGTLYDEGTTMVLNNDGALLLGGSSNSDTNPAGSKNVGTFGDFDFWILRLKETPPRIGDDSLVVSLSLSDNGYLLAGNSTSPRSTIKSGENRGGSDYWILRYDMNGELSWEKTLGGSQDDYLTDVHELSNGNIVVSGYSKSNRSGDKTANRSGTSDLWVVMLNANGETVWDRTYGGDGSETGGYIHQNSDGGILIGATSDSPRSGDKLQPSVDQDYWLLRTSPTGRIIWERTWQREGDQQTTDLILLSNDEIALAGRDESDIIDYFRYNQLGWRRNALQIGMNDPAGRYLLLEREDDVVIAGTQRNSYGDRDFTAFAFEQWGTVKWKRNYGGLGDELLSSITASGYDKFILSGVSSSGISKDRSTELSGQQDIWLTEISPYGYSLWDHSVEKDEIIGGGNVIPQGDSLIISGTIDNNGQEFFTAYLSAPVYPESNKDNWKTKIGETGLDGPVWSGFIPFKSTRAVETGAVIAGRSVNGEGGYKTSQIQGIWVLGIDNEGNVQWDRTFESSSDLSGLITTKAGYYLSLNTAEGIRLIHLNQSGIVLWDRVYANGSGDQVLETTEDTESRGLLLITSGRYIHIDEYGDIIWEKSHESFPYFSWQVETLPGTGYVIGEGGQMVKLDHLGNEEWAFDDPFDDLYGLSRSKDGGHFAFYSLYNLPGEDYVITGIRKINKNGGEVWSLTNRSFGSAVGFKSFTKQDHGFVLYAPSGQYAEFDPNGTMLLKSGVWSEESLGPDFYISDASEKDSTGYVRLVFDYDSYAYFLSAKAYAQPIIESVPPVNTEVQYESRGIQIYPNPATGPLWISLPQEEVTEIFFTDMSGRKYQTEWLMDDRTGRTNISGLPAGLYILTIQTASYNHIFRILKK